MNGWCGYYFCVDGGCFHRVRVGVGANEVMSGYCDHQFVVCCSRSRENGGGVGVRGVCC